MSRITTDLYVDGNLQGKTLTPSAGCVSNNHVSASAAIAATKLEHQYIISFAQANTTAAAETRVVHVARGTTGDILDVRAGSIGVCTGNATITVDVKKNGTSVLTNAITLDSGNAARVPEAGTLDGAQDELEADDVLEVVIAVNAGTGALGTGVFAAITLREDAA
jgi:hypothetical protein